MRTLGPTACQSRCPPRVPVALAHHRPMPAGGARPLLSHLLAVVIMGPVHALSLAPRTLRETTHYRPHPPGPRNTCHPLGSRFLRLLPATRPSLPTWAMVVCAGSPAPLLPRCVCEPGHQRHLPAPGGWRGSEGSVSMECPSAVPHQPVRVPGPSCSRCSVGARPARALLSAGQGGVASRALPRRGPLFDASRSGWRGGRWSPASLPYEAGDPDSRGL